MSTSGSLSCTTPVMKRVLWLRATASGRQDRMQNLTVSKTRHSLRSHLRTEYSRLYSRRKNDRDLISNLPRTRLKLISQLSKKPDWAKSSRGSSMNLEFFN